MPDPNAAVRRTLEAVWRVEGPRLIAGVMRTVRDIGLAEECAQEAFAAALERWPIDGVPDHPGAWLMTAARRRAIDEIRRGRVARAAHESIARDAGGELAVPSEQAMVDDRIDGVVEDDLLRLLFLACHPSLSREARAAFTLRLVANLSTDEIARAFLVPEPTIAQRIVRAKRTLATLEEPFEVPRGGELAERLASVLEVIYLLFNEGYSATSGDAWMRPELCAEALRIGRVLVGHMPREPEAHGLLALMELQASRLAARATPDGRPILLLDQDRTRWDQLLLRRGMTELAAAAAARTAPDRTPGPYELQASIAACHARAKRAAETDWNAIAGLYAELAVVLPSPVVDLNRAVAVAMADGPQAGLELVDALTHDPALAGYHLVHAVRGDLLEKLGRREEAAREFRAAAAGTRNERERSVLLARAGAGQDDRDDATRPPSASPSPDTDVGGE